MLSGTACRGFPRAWSFPYPQPPATQCVGGIISKQDRAFPDLSCPGWARGAPPGKTISIPYSYLTAARPVLGMGLASTRGRAWASVFFKAASDNADLSVRVETHSVIFPNRSQLWLHCIKFASTSCSIFIKLSLGSFIEHTWQTGD